MIEYDGYKYFKDSNDVHCLYHIPTGQTFTLKYTFDPKEIVTMSKWKKMVKLWKALR